MDGWRSAGAGGRLAVTSTRSLSSLVLFTPLVCVAPNSTETMFSCGFDTIPNVCAGSLLRRCTVTGWALVGQLTQLMTQNLLAHAAPRMQRICA